MTLLLAFGLMWSGANRQSVTVSFSCRAEPLGRLVQDLGKATGLALSVTKQCANDVLVVDAKAVNVKRLMAEIAKVDAGNWEPASGGFMFTADRVARNEEAHAERAQRAAEIQAEITKTLASLKDAESDREKQKATERAARAQELSKEVTVSRQGFVNFSEIDDMDVAWQASDILEILTAVDPNQLVLRPYQRTVFSTDPNSMQSPLSSHANRILAQLVQKHDVAALRFCNQMLAALHEDSHEQSPPLQSFLPTGEALLQGYAKADLSIETSSETSELEADLKFYDQNGAEILEDRYFLSRIAEGSWDSATQQTDHGQKTPIAHSDLSAQVLALPKELAEAEKLGTAYRHAADLKAVEQLLLDPEHHDPLSFGVTDGLLSLAHALGKPLVAVVPDNALSNFLTQKSANDTLEAFESKLQSGHPMVKTNADDWIEIKPETPDTERKLRLDRSALGKLIRAASSKGVPSLDDVAAYASNAPLPTTPGVSEWYMVLFLPSILSRPDNEPGNWSIYRIYGQLSSDSKQQLASGAKLPINSLGVSQRTDLADVVYGTASSLSVAQRSANMVSQRSSSGNPDSEATEILPEGVPDAGYLRMRSSQEPCFAPSDNVAEILNVFDIQGVAEVAATRAGQGHALALWSDPYNPTDMFRIGNRVTHSFTFVLNRNVSLDGSLSDVRLRKDAELFSLDNPPDDIKALLEQTPSPGKRNVDQPPPVQSTPPPSR